MAGLVPAIHVSVAYPKKNSDARHNAGHDESGSMNLGIRHHFNAGRVDVGRHSRAWMRVRVGVPQRRAA